MGSQHQPLLVVSGPTASGKSRLALRLASNLAGEIVSLDSVQVYQGFNIGSAKPSKAELSQVQHHMLDLCRPAQDFNVALFRESCAAVIEQIQQRGKSAVLVGGSTLYLTCLLHGLAELPSADAALRAELEALPAEQLAVRLNEIDSEAARRIHGNDKLRLIRALEACILAASRLSVAHKQHAYAETIYKAIIVVLCWPRSELYRRIEQRSEQMLSSGLIEETRELLKLYGKDARALRSLGYAQAMSYLSGEIDLAQLAMQIKQATRRFAKRQMTFFRNEPGKRGWLTRPRQDSQEGVVLVEEQTKSNLRSGSKDFRVISYNYLELAQALRARLASQTLESNELWYLDARALDLG